MSNSPEHPSRRWMSLGFICVVLLITSLDSTALYLALPNIALDFRTSASELQWIVNVYALVFGSLLLTMGNVGDRVGRKKIWMVGLLIFGVGALIAGFSQNTLTLIGARAIVGFASALMMPASLSIVIATFQDLRERAQAIAIITATFGFGAGLGPLVGGFIMDWLSWQAVFFVNVPLVLIALAGGTRYLNDSRSADTAKPDWVGALLSILGFFALLYGITEAGWHGWWAAHVLRAFMAAVVIMLLLFAWERRTPNAMIPLHLFRNRIFFGANTGLALVAFSLFGSIFFLSQYFQSVRGYSPFEAGVALLPVALIVMVVALFSAAINARLGERITISGGILLTALGLGYLASIAAVDTSLNQVYLGTSIMAIGLGVAMSPATAAIMSTVPGDQLGVGAALTDTTRQLGGALGVALLGSLLSSTYVQQIAVLEDLPMMALMPEQAMVGIKTSIQSAHFVADFLSLPVVSPLIVETANAAFVAGMIDGLVVATGILLGTACFTFMILPGKALAARLKDTGETFAVTPVGAD